MTVEEIFNIITTHKKYSTPNFEFKLDDYYSGSLIYTIGDNKYKIIITNGYSKINFYYNHRDYNFNFKEIDVNIIKNTCNRTTILSKFREVIKNISKIDILLTNHKIHLEKILPIIKSFIKSQYHIDFDFEKEGEYKVSSFRMKFPTTIWYGRRKRRQAFDLKSRLSSYDIDLLLESNSVNISFKFSYRILPEICYSTSENTEKFTEKLFLIHKKENFLFQKNITKILRSEKLKNIFN